MPHFFVISLFVVFLLSVAHFSRSLDYSDLEATGVACPNRDCCRGYKKDDLYNSLLYRSCECDSACHIYQDCCIDVERRSSAERASNIMCLNNGDRPYIGIYAVFKCSGDWNGPKEVKQKCEGPLDLSDPVLAAPVTSTSKSVTYKNRYCAECNDANTNSLKMFIIRVVCPGLRSWSVDKIMDVLSYNKLNKEWGYTSNRTENPGFKECAILFNVPSYLQKSVRFCRPNFETKCAQDWTGLQVKLACDEYMAVVYVGIRAYKNPHCAICNHVPITNISCYLSYVTEYRETDYDSLDEERVLFSIKKILDINNPDSHSKHIYDPFFKKSRELSCVLPEYVVENGKCVPDG